jgi:VWFA-related protein
MSKHLRFALATLVTASLFAQQVGTNQQSKDVPSTFSTSAQLVVETVVVKDKAGNAIQGLTQKDFLITEDGVPQTIKFFEYQNLPDASTPEPAFTKAVAPRQKYPSAQISPERQGSGKYTDKRLLAMFFDMTAMPVPDQLRSFASAEKFVRTQVTTADLVSIMMFSGGAVRVLEDFTNDRERLLRTIETLIIGEDQGNEETVSDESASDTGAAFGQDDSEFNIFNTDRQLAALQTAAKMLGTLNEKKSMIYFASGLKLQGLDNQAQLHATVNAAVRAGVSIWAVDARGLVASAPMGDATKGSPGSLGMYTGNSAMQMTSNFQRSQDTLWSIATDTGGKALLDNNDLSAGIVNAQKAISSYYLIGYYTSNQALDGKFRRIKISLNNGAIANLDYRQGYFAGKVFAKFTAADKERQLEDALMLADPITELTIAMEVDYFQLNRAEYFVPLIVKIPGSELARARRFGAEHTLIDFIGEVKDEFGSTITNVRDKIDVKLTDQTSADLAKRPVEYDTGFTLLPGTYTIKFLARDSETGRIGTYQTKFVVPNLNKVDTRIPISSVVLASQRMAAREAIYSVKDKQNAAAVNPLIVGGEQLIPSVTRVFSKSRDMYVFLEAYERGATTQIPLYAFVTFYRGQTKAFETPPLPVTDGLDPKSKAVPLRFSISLGKLATGEYNCQVTVLDPASQKAAFWSAPVMLVP